MSLIKETKTLYLLKKQIIIGFFVTKKLDQYDLDGVEELTERMNKCRPDRSCFLAGTLVETKTEKKAIEEIEEGEEVWCEEESTGEQKLKKVLNRIEKNDILYHLYIGNEEIHTTEDYAIWLEGEGWRKAEDVHVGDIVRCRTGEPEKITNVWMEKLPEQMKVYNLSVEDVHNYYVSEKGVLVHNECPKNNKVNIGSIDSERKTISSPYDLQATHKQTLSKKNMNKLIEDIKNNGINETIKYVEHNGQKYVVDGHHRLIVAKRLGLKEVLIEKVELPYAGYESVEDLFWID